MSTPTLSKPSAKPKPAPPLHERLAADLRTLADITTANPDLAQLIAAAVRDLHLVVTISGPVRAAQVTEAAVAAGATVLHPNALDPYWATTGVALPAGLVRLTVTQLTPPLDDDALAAQEAEAVWCDEHNPAGTPLTAATAHAQTGACRHPHGAGTTPVQA